MRFPTEALLMEAARRIDEWSRIGSKVSHLRLVPRLPPPEAQGSEPLDLVPFEWEVLAAVDGARDLRSLAEMLGRSEFEVARTVYGLTNAGIVVLDDPAHPGQEAEPGRDLAALLVPGARGPGGGPVRSGGRRARGGAPADPLMPEARRLLGLCYAGLGRFSEALELWARGTGWVTAHPEKRRRRRRSTVSASRWRRSCGSWSDIVTDDIRGLTARLADEPGSLAFLELAEALRRRGQLDAAHKVARGGLTRYPGLADAHDLMARILSDQGDLAGAFDAWASALQLDPMRTSALKGVAFLYFRAGERAAAMDHLQRALEVDPDDVSIRQAIARLGPAYPEPVAAAPPAPAAPQVRSRRHRRRARERHRTSRPRRPIRRGGRRDRGLLLVDANGLRLGGRLADGPGDPAGDRVAAQLAGVSREAARATRLLGLGAGTPSRSSRPTGTWCSRRRPLRRCWSRRARPRCPWGGSASSPSGPRGLRAPGWRSSVTPTQTRSGPRHPGTRRPGRAGHRGDRRAGRGRAAHGRGGRAGRRGARRQSGRAADAHRRGAGMRRAGVHSPARRGRQRARRAGPRDLVLVAVVGPDANLGLARLEMLDAAGRLA